MVLNSFSSFNFKRMRAHLTGEEEGYTRVVECKRALKASRDFYRDEQVSGDERTNEQDRSATAAKAKPRRQNSVIKEEFLLSKRGFGFKKKQSSWPSRLH